MEYTKENVLGFYNQIQSGRSRQEKNQANEFINAFISSD